MSTRQRYRIVAAWILTAIVAQAGVIDGSKPLWLRFVFAVVALSASFLGALAAVADGPKR